MGPIRSWAAVSGRRSATVHRSRRCSRPVARSQSQSGRSGFVVRSYVLACGHLHHHWRRPCPPPATSGLTRRSRGDRRLPRWLALMDTADSLRVRARVVEELASYARAGAEAGARVDVRWPTDRVAERIESRRSRLVAPYRSLLRVLEADRRPETARL